MRRSPYDGAAWKTRLVVSAVALVGAGVLEAVAFGDRTIGITTCGLGVILGAQAMFARRK